MVITLGSGRQVVVDTPFTSSSEEETRAWGLRLGGMIPPGTVVGLTGELGAGKTVLAGALLHGAGLDPSIRVTSPTFTLMNRYPGAVPYAHVDLYRLDSAADAFDAGIDEALGDPGEGIVVVEWIERFPEIWPGHHLGIEIQVTAPTGRLIQAEAVHA